MPTTRRAAATARGRAAPEKGQSTISFSGKVTKSGIPVDAKKAIVSPAVTTVDLPRHTKPIEEEEKVEDAASVEPKIAQVEVEEEEEEEEEIEEDEEEGVLEVEKAPAKSEADLRAEKVSDAQINKYWRGVEKQRKSPRVHQGDLMQSEKILRYFDVSSQYGPCIGIDRMKRWNRAERLGLNPPMEVLAVLLREEAKGTEGVETAHMDHLMSSTALGGV